MFMHADALLAAISAETTWHIDNFVVDLYSSPDVSKTTPTNLVEWLVVNPSAKFRPALHEGVCVVTMSTVLSVHSYGFSNFSKFSNFSNFSNTNNRIV